MDWPVLAKLSESDARVLRRVHELAGIYAFGPRGARGHPLTPGGARSRIRAPTATARDIQLHVARVGEPSALVNQG